MKELIMFAVLALASAVMAAQPPNIILILADDQGWTGLSAQMDPEVPGSKSDFYQTPNLERLAKEGMCFSQGYAPGPVCSPTRHSIQFGMSPAKTRVTFNAAGNRQFCVPALALPNLIKRADSRYATAHFGKWHVSLKPEECGYDVSDGSTGNGDGNPKNQPDDPKRVSEVTSRSVAFMERQVAAGTPFFMQVSHYADHLALKSSPAMLEKYQALPPGKHHNDPVFAGMNEDLDQGVGGILDAVDRLGIKNDTYIIYMADNGFDEGHGTHAERGAWPLSHSKGFVYEGGIRVPFIVRGPGIEANSFSKIPVIGYDLMPTFLELIKPGFLLPDVTEGGSMLSVLKNGGIGEIKRKNDFFIFHYPSGSWPAQTSLIKGDYKILKSWETGRVELFNLRTDISETKDLNQSMPEKTEELHGAMMDYLKSVNAIIPSEGELTKKGKEESPRGKNRGKKKAGK